jgi:hypothetical protein
MIRIIEVARISRIAMITASAGLSVQLLPIPISQAPGGRLIAPASISSNALVTVPSVRTVSATVVTPPMMSATSRVGLPAVQAGGVTATPLPIPASASVATPSLIVGDASVMPVTIPMTSMLEMATVTAGSAAIGATVIASNTAVQVPSVIAGTASIALAFVVPTSIVSSPSVSAGSVSIAPVSLAPASNVPSPAVSVASGYDSDAQSYFAAMSGQPDSTRKGLLNDLVVGLKADGVWPSLDWLVLLASHDEQSARLNAIIPSKAVAAINSPAFTPNLGFTGDASSSYVVFGETLGAAGKATLNSATIGVWCNQTGGTLTGLSSHFGRASNATPQATIRPQGSSGSSDQIALNDNNGANFRQSTGTRNGHRTAVRLDGNVKQGFFNGARVFNSTAVAVVGIANGNMSLLRNDTAYSADRLAAAYTGAGLTDALVAALHSRLSTYLTAIGAA